MSRNSAATESSREWASTQDILGSTSQPAATTDRNNYATGNEGNENEVGEAIVPTFIPALTPPLSPGSPLSSTLSPADPTYLPSESKNALQLPPLVPVRRPSESQLNVPVQSISSPVSQDTFTPLSPIPELPSQYSRESYRAPTTQTPQSRTFGDVPTSSPSAPRTPYQSLNSNPPRMFPSQQDTTPLRQSPPNTPSIYPGMSSQSYRSQPYHSSHPRPFIPPPQSYSSQNARTPRAQSSHEGMFQPLFPQPAPSQAYNLPNAPAPQSHMGTSQPFMSQTPGSLFGYTPLQEPFSSLHVPAPAIESQVPRKGFVASDPFRVSHGDDKVDASDGLTFDDIPTAKSFPRRKFSQGMVNTPYATLPSRPVFGGHIPNTASPPRTYGYSSTRPDIYHPPNVPSWGPPVPQFQPHTYDNSRGEYATRPPADVPEPQVPLGRSSWVPEPSVPFQTSYNPPFREDDDDEEDAIRPPPNVPAPQTPPKQPSKVPELPIPLQTFATPLRDEEEESLVQPSMKHKTSVQSQVSLMPDSPVSLTQHSLIIGPIFDDTVTPLSAIPVGPVFTSGSNQSSNVPHLHYDYTGHPSFLQQPQHQDAELPKWSIYSQLTRFFRYSHHLEIDWHEVTFKFVLVTFIRQLYLHFLLRLPLLYLSRVARIFKEADLTLSEIKEMVLEMASQGLTHKFEIEMAFESSSIPPVYKKLTSTWESFIDSVMREWQTFNIISVLLLTAILTILQIQSAAEDPLTRYTALFSLMCALISLLFGCMYIIRFGTMRETHKAAEWALEAQKTTMVVWWNIWVLLAMPAIWLTWSIILYIACIMSFVWRSGVANSTPHGISDTGELIIRIIIAIVLGIGLLYSFLIMTTFRQYGSVMDEKWKRRIDRWVEEKAAASPAQPTSDSPWYPSYGFYPDGSRWYQPPTYKPSTDYQPSYGDAQAGNAWYTYAPAHASHSPPEPYLRPTGSPHSTSSMDTTTRLNTMRNKSSKTQDDNSTIPAEFIPSPEAIPLPLPPKVPSTTTADIPPMLIPKRTPIVIPQSLSPTLETPYADGSSKDSTLGFSSRPENGVGGDDGGAPNDEGRVRFLSLTSEQGHPSREEEYGGK